MPPSNSVNIVNTIGVIKPKPSTKERVDKKGSLVI